MVDRTRYVFAAAVLLAFAGEASAQSLSRPTASIEATTDHRRRGLSWSDGDPALDAIVSVPLSGGFRVDGRATTLRNSTRHRDADAVFDASASYTHEISSGLTLTGGATGHFFAGAERRADYAEIDGMLGFAIGPAQLDLSANYAPSQSTIGGDNLYVQARAGFGIPMTGINLSAHVGHTTGSTDNPLLAARLRPDGDYTDWGVRAEQQFGPIAVGLRYSGTSIDTDRVVDSPYAEIKNAGNRLTAHAVVSF